MACTTPSSATISRAPCTCHGVSCSGHAAPCNCKRKPCSCTRRRPCPWAATSPLSRGMSVRPPAFEMKHTDGRSRLASGHDQTYGHRSRSTAHARRRGTASLAHMGSTLHGRRLASRRASTYYGCAGRGLWQAGTRREATILLDQVCIKNSAPSVYHIGWPNVYIFYGYLSTILPL